MSGKTLSPADRLKAMFHFCPHCGGKRFVENDFKSLRCEECDFVFYLNASAATTALIVNDNNELLVIHRKLEPMKGWLDLPGGFVDAGETIEEGMVREIKEETGLSVEKPLFLFSFPNDYMYSGLDVPTVDAVFLCKVSNAGAICASDDAADARWVSVNKLKPSEFAFRSTRHAVEKFIEMTQNA